MSSSSSTPPTVVLDALPYVDVVHEDYEAYALALVQEEMSKISPPSPKNELKPISSHESTILKEEYKLIESGKQRTEPAVAENKATIHVPTSDNVEEWKEAIGKARAAFEAERLRSEILQLESNHAPPQWKHYTSTVLQPLEQQETAAHNQISTELQEIHAQRQQEQVEAKKTLDQLEQRYRDLIQKRHYLQMATVELEQEVERMKNEEGQE